MITRIAARLLVPIAAIALFAACSRSNDEQAPPATTPVALPALDLPEPGGDLLAEATQTIGFWQQRAERDPADTTAWNSLGAAYVRRARQGGDVSDYVRAAEAYEASLDVRRAANFGALVGLAGVYNTQHRFEEAVPIAAEAIAQEPDEAFGFAVLGDAYVPLGRYDLAREAFDAMLECDRHTVFLARDAFLRQLTGDTPGAAAAWDEALAAEVSPLPDDAAWLRAQVARFHLNTGNPRQAEALLDEALAVFPGYVPALAVRADLAVAQGDLPLAAAYYDAIVSRDPAPESAMALGALYEMLGDQQAAEVQYGLVDAFGALYAANGIETNLSFARYWADRQVNLDEALAVAEAAYPAAPGVSTADTLAWVHFRRGDAGLATPFAREAVAAGSRDPLVLYHAGAILAEAGDSGEARELVSAAVALNPGFSPRFAADAAALLTDLDATVVRP